MHLALACVVFVLFGLVSVPTRAIDVSCPECKEIVALVYNISESPIALNTTVDVLIDICDEKFANDTRKRGLCVDMMKLGEWVLPELFHGLTLLAWNIPITFCADIVKACHEPCCSAGAPPQEVFINFADSKDLSQMRVTWITLNETEGAGVEYWTESGFERAAKETTRTYTAGGWLGVIHSAVMTGLAPDTKYTYRVGSSVYGWSANFTFRTLPTEIGVPSRPLRIIQIADTGVTPKATPTIELIETLVREEKVDFIIHNGDIAYADGDEFRNDIFFKKIQSFAAYVPYMTTPGNHELYMNFSGYKARMAASMPATVPAAPPQALYYALTVGPVEFVFMDSETFIDTAELDAVQMRWFGEHMQTVNRSAQPLVTVAHHRPLYCGGCITDIMSEILRSEGEAAFLSAKVDLHLTGHVHNYQRMYPVRNSTLVSKSYVDPGVPVYIVNGAGGNFEGQSGFAVTADYVANGSTDYGISYITYSVDRHAGEATVEYQFINSYTKKVFDSFTLLKHL